jgi:hypothetical protein
VPAGAEATALISAQILLNPHHCPGRSRRGAANRDRPARVASRPPRPCRGPHSPSKAAGLRNLPCKEAAENHAWLECVLAAADLVAWSKLICFAEDPDLACCEIANFRYQILHTAARITRSGRVVYLRLDRTWNWAKQLALGFSRLRAAFA